MNLNYFMPTRVIMGRDCIENNKDIFTHLGKKAMIVTGANSAKINGSQKAVIGALEASGIEYILYDKVMSNPTIECVYEGAEIARESGIDFVVAIGGGSPMDAGKAIALLASQDIKEENLFSGKYENKALPMVLVPTTAGTGSEVTPYAVLTNNKAQTKMSIASPLLFPAVAFLNAEYTMQLSLVTTINTAIDALSHAIEGMISVRASVMSNALAVQGMEYIRECLPRLKSGKLSLEDREKLLYGSMLAGMTIAQTGTTAAHTMGYHLTYFKNVDHGRACGLFLGELLAFTEKEEPELIRSILKAMKVSSVAEFITVMDNLLGEKEVLTKEEIEQYAKICMGSKNIRNCKVKPTYDDIVKIYQASLGSQC